VAELSKAIARLMEERGLETVDPPPLRAVLDRLRAMVTPLERPLVDAFARQLFGKSGAELLAAGNAQTWAALTLDAFRFVNAAGTDDLRVRVFNPDVARDGWDCPDTIVQTIMRDRPFIVDTIHECVQKEVGQPHRLMHPIFATERDRTGALQSIGAAEVVGRNESFVHVEIPRLADTAALHATLTAGLQEVIAATDDYQAMRARVGAFAEVLRTQRMPPPWNEEVDEIADFLDWLAQRHFVFLGFREYQFSGQGAERRAGVCHGSGLGILRDDSRSSFAEPRALPSALRRRLNEPPLLLVSKTNAETLVHRRARMDYIGLKRIDASGVVAGEYRFLGLFTAKAYAEESAQVPLLRRKLEAVLTAAEAVPNSHDYRAIVELFNTIPKEELFGSAAAELGEEIATIRQAEGRDRVRVVCRPDALGRGVFVVVILPREQFSADLERRVEQQLQRTLNGLLLHQHTALDDFERVRLHFYFGADMATQQAATPDQLEADLADLLRTWDDRLIEQLARESSPAAARELAARYVPAFSAGYRLATEVGAAVHDIRCIEAMRATRAPQVDVFNDDAAGTTRFTALKLYLLDEAIVLSEFLPLLESLGLTVFEEDHLDVPLLNFGTVRIHRFFVQAGGARLDVDAAEPRLSAAVLALRAREVESDALNRLVLQARLTWREVDLLRAYVGHAQQAQMAARELLIDALVNHPEPAALLFEAFRTKFDPALLAVARERLPLMPPIEARFFASLDAVESVQDDRILRALWSTVAATVRTNFYMQPSRAGSPARAGEGTIAVKIESAQLAHLPRPHPLFEIYVHAPHMSGIHLRSSRVARGGIRLSDRPDDFRTEVLGLMKTQTVKNAVIVPGGAKGGFVVKRRSTAPTAGSPTIAAYRSLIGGLLDLTDNLVHGAAVSPPELIVYDDADPYLVVAADKGTATFSDTANEIAASYRFWLGDAFASGGSHGYDHKREGITAKGAWESVRQHFRALGRVADAEPLSVIGIGDMSGDVFGNGLLRSPHVRLRAAFDHRHIFLDPNPDPVASFAERERLFALPRSDWTDYTAALISEGGGVFARAAKKIPLSPAVRTMLGVEADSLSGEELIRAILRMETDLLWNGGIGTYVKARGESHADVGDRANDNVRVDATELRVTVVGEGGNLGFTQRARVEYALAGGAINTDAIDNSAGVDLSDHEVNLKIALGRSVEGGLVTADARNQLLAELTAEVCDQVLDDNRRQARALTIDQVRSRARLNEFRELIGMLEAEAQLDRQLEQLPDRDAQRARRATFLGLTRPELAVVLAYTKLHLQHVLVQSTLPDDPFLERFLRRYFPAAVNDRFGDGVRSHRLRREIIAVTVANWLIDAMGMTFVSRIARDAGAGPVMVVKAWIAVVAVTKAEDVIDRMLTGMPALSIEADQHCATVLADAFERAVKWVVETQPTDYAVDDWVEGFALPVETLQYGVNELLSDDDRRRERAVLDTLLGAGTPPSLAQSLMALRRTADLLEIDQIAHELDAEIELAAEVYYRAGDLVDFEWLREVLHDAAARAADTRWERRALEGLAEALVQARRQLTRSLLSSDLDGHDIARRVAAYLEPRTAQLDTVRRLIDDIKSARQPTLAALVVIMREVSRFTGR